MPNGKPEKIGLKALFDDKDFQKGLASYLRGTKQAETQTGSAASAMSGFAGIMQTAVGTALGYLAARAIPAVISGLKNLTSNAILSAARIEELQTIVQLLGQRMGFTQTELEGYVQSVIDAGIRTDVANKLIAQFARYNIDLSKAVDLATVAQDAAIFSMKDSSETLDHLLHGILTQRTMVLRNAGVIVNLQQAYKDLAKELGISSDELNATERTTAALNAVLEAGIPIAGAYEAAMELPGKQLRSLTGRDIPELIALLGKPYQEAFGTAIGVTRDIVTTWQDAAREGGRLEPILTKLGAAASVAADLFADFAMRGSEALLDFIENFGSEMIDAATDAFIWGANIIVEFAAGMIHGAATALTFVMNTITNLLTSWLAPGSAPKVAPDLVKWGAEAMGEWLKGFTQANFDILKGVQGPLLQAMRQLVAVGAITAQQMADTFADVSTKIAEAISGDGILGEDVFAAIAEAAGPFGEQIADLARKEVTLAKSIDAVRKANERLSRAQENTQEAQRELAEQVREYNEALLAGAPEQTLRALREQIELAEEGVFDSRIAESAAEQELALSEDKVDVLKSERDLQNELIKQLLTISQLQVQAIQKAKKPKVKKAEAAAEREIPDLGELAEIDLAKPLNEAFEAAKEAIRQKLEEMFAPIREKWEEVIKPALDELGESWDNFTAAIGEAWDRWVQPVIDHFEALIPPGLLVSIGEVSGAFLAFLLVLGIVGLVIGAVMTAIILFANPITQLILLISTLKAAWDNNWDGIRDKLTEAWGKIKRGLNEFWLKVKDLFTKRIPEAFSEFWDEKVKPILESVEEFFKVKIPEAFDELKKKWEKFKLNFIDPVITAFEGVGKAVDKVVTFFGDLVTGAADLLGIRLPSWLQFSSPPPLQLALEGIGQAMDDLSRKKLPEFQAQMAELRLPDIERSSSRLGSQPIERTINNMTEWNVQVDANYSERQSPVRVADDLAAVVTMAQS